MGANRGLRPVFAIGHEQVEAFFTVEANVVIGRHAGYFIKDPKGLQDLKGLFNKTYAVREKMPKIRGGVLRTPPLIFGPPECNCVTPV